MARVKLKPQMEVVAIQVSQDPAVHASVVTWALVLIVFTHDFSLKLLPALSCQGHCSIFHGSYVCRHLFVCSFIFRSYYVSLAGL